MVANSPRRRPGPKPRPGTREGLIAAGVEALHAAGFAASGVNEILVAAGVPKGSFYHHFDSKEAFGVEVIGTLSQHSLAALQSSLSDQRLSPRQRLIADFQQRSRAFERSNCVRGCLFGNLSLEVADHSEAMRDALKSHFRQWCDLLEAPISAAQRDGSIRNPMPARKLAEFTLNAWEGAVLRSRTEKTGEALALFHEVIFNGVLA
jgi:TetR/AcrR family transcriptional regulator, transcriptional repressor for nem operon